MNRAFKKTMDAKGRVPIPDHFLPNEGRSIRREFTIVSHPDNRYLLVYPKDHPPSALGKRELSLLEPYSREMLLDAANRLLINADLRTLYSFSNKEKAITLIGNKESFQIWSTKKWQDSAAARREKVVGILDRMALDT